MLGLYFSGYTMLGNVTSYVWLDLFRSVYDRLHRVWSGKVRIGEIRTLLGLGQVMPG
jgi:hypothetical protein